MFKKFIIFSVIFLFILTSTSILVYAYDTPTVAVCLLDKPVPAMISLPEPIVLSCEIDSIISCETDSIEEETLSENNEDSYYINITNDERELLARLVFLEAGICSDECKRNIVSVVFNRLYSGHWNIDMNNDDKITLYDIIYFPTAFSPAKFIPYVVPTQECYDAVDYVTMNGLTLPEFVRYFRIDYDFEWENYCNYICIDNTYFGYLSNWEDGVW